MKHWLALFAVLSALSAHTARADELRPGYLELRQTAFGTYDLLFKVPARNEDLRLAIYVSLPEGTQDVAPPRTSFGVGAYVERRIIHRDGGLIGRRIAIDGLSAPSTDVLVRIESLGGAVPVTAFTIAHSITLAAATLGFVDVPGPPVEATIALSIMRVAVEILNARQGKPSLTARLPWLAAFAFGLLHGFGFAGALAEVGLPRHAIPVALLFFNVGVEVGQLVFVTAVLSLIWLLRRAASRLLETSVVKPAFDRLDGAIAYGIGIVAAYWLIERTTAFFA